MIDRRNFNRRRNKLFNATTIEISEHHFNRKTTIEKELQLLRSKK